jgi:hypothetical protein
VLASNAHPSIARRLEYINRRARQAFIVKKSATRIVPPDHGCDGQTVSSACRQPPCRGSLLRQ